MGKSKRDKRRNSSDNYSSQSKAPKHGGSTDEAMHSVSDTLKEVNNVLYSPQPTMLESSVFEPCDTYASNSDPHRTQAVLSSDTSQQQQPSLSTIFDFVKSMDAKISAMDQKLAKLDLMEKKMTDMGTEVNKLWNFVHDKMNATDNKLSETQSHMEALEFTLGLTSDRLELMQRDRDALREDVLYMQSQSMRNNLMFSRLPEKDDEKPEDTENIVRQFMVDKLKIEKDNVDRIQFERVHRTGSRDGPARCRNIVAKFTLFKDREFVKRHRANLKGTNYSVYEQFPREINERRKSLIPRMKDARSKNQRAWISYDKLYINGKEVSATANITSSEHASSNPGERSMFSQRPHVRNNNDTA